MIWGTNINVRQCILTFQNFINLFTITNNHNVDNDDELINQSYYLQELYLLNKNNTLILNLNCNHLNYYDYSTQILYKQLISHPNEIIPIFDRIINDQYCRSKFC
jgi:DNA replication licensing factor MCM4